MKTEHIITLARAYARHTGLKLSTVSTYAANGGAYLTGLERGKSCTFRNYERLIAWFDKHWPGDLDWPSDIDRPSRRAA